MPDVHGSQGVQAGDNNVQYNFFSGRQPRGPVVAGSVPQAPPAFQPREDLMAQLRAAGVGVPIVRAVTGMRGAGKSQLAAAYARECIDNGWRLVAWINAEDTPAILSGLEVVANRLGIDRPGAGLQEIGTEVCNHVEADGDRCLVVYDNVTDPGMLRPYLPSGGKSQVVVTSTRASALALGSPTQVPLFTRQESRDFLAERTRLPDPAGATALSVELGCLPLALAQAAAVIKARHLTYQVYQARLLSYPTSKYLPPASDDPYPRGVAESILLSIDTVTAADEAGLCADLLGVISVLSPDGVPRDLLYLGESGDVFAADAEAIDEALARLAEASLLTFGSQDQLNLTVAAHRLVMRVVRERRVHEGTHAALATKACALLAAAAGSLGEPWQHRTRARNLVQQVIALNDHMAPSTGADEQLAAALLARREWALSCLGRLGDSAAQAVEFGVPLVADQVRVLGEDHPDTMISQGNLALAYQAAGRWGEAIPLFERTLADQVRVLGEDHPNTLTTRNNLALAYYAAGRWGEAIPLFERTLAKYVQVLGEDHPKTLTSRNNLAFAYQTAGRGDEAIPLLERTLADRVRVLGEDHPDTLMSRANLASAYQAARRSGFGKAIPLFERTLADQVRVLGEDHPSTLTTRGSLASAYQAARRFGKAIPLFERTLADYARVLGEDHPSTLTTRANLASTYRAAGRSGEAIPLFERTLADYVQTLGEDHPGTLVSRANLALAYYAAGRSGEAIPLFEEALGGLERVLGAEHPSTVLVRKNLAHARRAAEKRGNGSAG